MSSQMTSNDETLVDVKCVLCHAGKVLFSYLLYPSIIHASIASHAVKDRSCRTFVWGATMPGSTVSEMGYG